MRELIIEKLNARFNAYADLIELTDDEALQRKLNVERHKSLMEHLWCVVGARESYAQALSSGKWPGFNCSMTSFTQADFRVALKSSADRVLSILTEIEEWDDDREAWLAELSEHEVMHEGGIIRHLYGSRSPIPASFRWA